MDAAQETSAGGEGQAGCAQQFEAGLACVMFLARAVQTQRDGDSEAGASL